MIAAASHCFAFPLDLGKECSGWQMKAPRQCLDLPYVEIALSTENFRNHALAAHFGQISLRQAMLLYQELSSSTPEASGILWCSWSYASISKLRVSMKR